MTYIAFDVHKDKRFKSVKSFFYKNILKNHNQVTTNLIAFEKKLRKYYEKIVIEKKLTLQNINKSKEISFDK